jgi:ATP-binding cassette subfamily B multidrug efflux pump
MEVGALTAFIAYILQILLAIMMAMYVFSTAPRAAVCAERIQDVLDVTPALAVPAGTGYAVPAGTGPAGTRPAAQEPAAPAGKPGAGHPQWRGSGVQPRLVRLPRGGVPGPGRHLIYCRTGTTTAIIGATGSGKSTLLNLLPRFLNATSGEIRFGGADIRKLSAERLRERISMVPQHSYLFSGTVASNLRMAGPAATEDDLWKVLRLAQADDFVRLLPDGLHAAVAQGGAGLSGGQRQRLCIARAMLRTADLYLFDDSFSALDYATEAAVTRALEPVLAAATVLMVAERIPTIMGADRILVLEEGRLVAQGTHAELLGSSPTYREIAESQLALDEQP